MTGFSNQTGGPPRQSHLGLVGTLSRKRFEITLSTLFRLELSGQRTRQAHKNSTRRQ